MTCYIECPWKVGLMCEATEQLRQESRCLRCPAYPGYMPVADGAQMGGTD